MRGDPNGVATPKPLASRFLPTFIVSQGSLSFVYSFFGLSISRAYFPLLVLTLRIPSSYVFTNTCFLEFMNSHILLYKLICDFCKMKIECLHSRWLFSILYILLYVRSLDPLTRKKSQVDPWDNVPYCTSVCEARSSGELIGATILSTVRNAAKLAVYEEIRIRVKNHHTLPTIRPDIDLLQACLFFFNS